MSSRPRPLLVAVLLALAAGLPGPTRAGAPTDQLRDDIDRLFGALQQQRAPSPGGAANEILDRMFDWTRMAEAALGGYWRERTPEERAEFTRLFALLFRRAYVSRAKVVDASKFQYLGDAITGDRAVVKTKVLTKRGSTIDVDYAVHLDGGRRWLVGDVLVERMSLVDSYRTQFSTIIARSSYDALVSKLRSAVAK